MEKQIEKVKELLEKHAENVSVNHWIRAIHEDKFQMVAEEVVKLFPISDVIRGAVYSSVYSREECVFKYCDAPKICKKNDKCRHC